MNVLESSFNSNGRFGWELVPDDFPLVVLHTLFADPDVEPIVFLYQFSSGIRQILCILNTH